MNTNECGVCNNEMCVNPISYLLKEIEAVNLTNTGNLFISMVLDPGILLRDSTKFCCPDCTSKDGFYFLGSLGDFQSITDALNMSGNTKEKKYPCCVNTHIGSDDLITWKNNFKEDKLPCCESTGFNEAIIDLAKLKHDRVDLIEASTFKGISGLAIINLFLQNVTWTDDQKINFIDEIVTSGIVVKCFECDIFIYNASTFVSRLSDFNLP